MFAYLTSKANAEPDQHLQRMVVSKAQEKNDEGLEGRVHLVCGRKKLQVGILRKGSNAWKKGPLGRACKGAA